MFGFWKNGTMPSISDSLGLVTEVTAPFVTPEVTAVPDAELLDAQRMIGQARRRLDTLAAVVAGEIAHRSRRELGHDGLAQTRGQRTAEGLISQLTGSSTRDARTLVKAAELLPGRAEADARPASGADGTCAPEAGVVGTPTPGARWRAVLGAAVASTSISAEAAGIIRTRLAATERPGGAQPTPDGASDGAATAVDDAREAALEAAARQLVAAAPHLTIEQLAAG